MLITGFATLMLAATAVSPRRGADCVAIVMPMAWHDGGAARRPRVIRIDRAERPRPRCFRLTAR